MEGKRDDWRIVALITVLGDAIMFRRREFWICSGLRELDLEIRNLHTLLAYVIEGREHNWWICTLVFKKWSFCSLNPNIVCYVFLLSFGLVIFELGSELECLSDIICR